MSVLDWLNAWVENCVVSERPANRSGSSMYVACPLAVGFFLPRRGLIQTQQK